jgi:oxygen-independent coproporphyrinogen-3 oxidase
MSGIYIHIPFCKQACSYCDFHFSTKMTSKDQMIEALCMELKMRKDSFAQDQIASIYFGGGTPSVLSPIEIERLIEAVYSHYSITDNPEITLEANPDDLSEDYIQALSKTKVNRISVGIQSFHQEDLSFMNRAHNASQSKEALHWVKQYFDNYSIDLIYGVPMSGRTSEEQDLLWIENVTMALAFSPNHISVYALTVEPKTVLDHQIKSGKLPPLDESRAYAQFNELRRMLKDAAYEHYEFSNFSKEGFYAVNNSGYWEGKRYMGVGPSSHSYDGESRSWNAASNPLYIKAIFEGIRPFEVEYLSVSERYNEYIMTGLRTTKGVELAKINALFGPEYESYVIKEAQKKIAEGLLELVNETVLKITAPGLFFTDGIVAQLFYID